MEQITLIENAIHRPGEPRHYMEFRYPTTRYLARIGELVVADSSRVLKLAEVYTHVYDPMIYFPLDDTRLDLLRPSDKTTHCPLKGDTTYYDFVGGDTSLEAVAWCYSAPLDFASALADYVAFDPRQVGVVTA